RFRRQEIRQRRLLPALPRLNKPLQPFRQVIPCERSGLRARLLRHSYTMMPRSSEGKTVKAKAADDSARTLGGDHDCACFTDTPRKMGPPLARGVLPLLARLLHSRPCTFLDQLRRRCPMQYHQTSLASALRTLPADHLVDR